MSHLKATHIGGLSQFFHSPNTHTAFNLYAQDRAGVWYWRAGETRASQWYRLNWTLVVKKDMQRIPELLRVLWWS